MNIGILACNHEWKDPDRPWPILAVALRALGHKVRIAAPVTLEPFGSAQFDWVLCWNGDKGLRGRIVAEYRAAGTPLVILERGFFDRNRHVQIDTRGFNHTASWAARIREPAPACSGERLKALGIEPKASAVRKGCTLVLGQTPGDAQLTGQAVQPDDLLALVQAANPMREVRFRPHPRVREEERPLAEDLAGAAFVVTINSNAGNDAILAGVPVLALGESLYTMGGAAFRGSPSTIVRDLADMRHGWTPDEATVRNYLGWLACRQFSNADLTDGKVIAAVMQGEDPWASGQLTIDDCRLTIEEAGTPHRRQPSSIHNRQSAICNPPELSTTCPLCANPQLCSAERSAPLRRAESEIRNPKSPGSGKRTRRASPARKASVA